MNSLESNGNDHNLDRLSALPDSLILEILSLLNMRDVVRTSLLSKRWNCLWMTTPCLQFYARGEHGDSVKIRNFISRALTLWRGTHLRKFSIDLLMMKNYKIPSLSRDIDLWLFFAKQMKVEELLIAKYNLFLNKSYYCPPQCLYECSSLRKLTLVGCDLQIHGGVQWDHLNSLELRSCCFHEDVLNQILASSAQLETVTLVGYMECENLSIRSSSLKKLVIFSIFTNNLKNATIYAPNLESLQLEGTPFNKYLLTSVSSLTEVLLDFKGYFTEEEVSGAGAVVEEALCQILPAIQHVVTVLELSASCVKMLGVMKGKLAFSPLLNVKLLRISCGGLAEIRELVGLLEVFPKLKTLIIDWGYHENLFEFNGENYTMCEANILKSNLLRTVEIIWTGHLHASIFQFIECLLKHSTMIEKIVIRKIDYMYRLLMFEATENVTILQSSYEDMFLAAQKVVRLQRSFPCVELVLLKSIR